MIASASLWLALALASPSAPGPAQDRSVAVEVDVSALPESDVTQRIQRTLQQRQVAVLEDGGITVADQADATIRVTVSRYGEGDVHYRFVVALYDQGSPTPTLEQTATCEACLDSELYDKVSQEVARLSGRMMVEPSTPPPESVEPESTEPVPREEEPKPETSEPAPRVRRIGGVGWAGYGLVVAGLATDVGGIVVLRTPEARAVPGQADRTAQVTGYRVPLGYALVGAGVGVTIVGAVLVIVDQTILLKRRRERARPTSLAPLQLRSGLGLTWSVRF